MTKKRNMRLVWGIVALLILAATAHVPVGAAVQGSPVGVTEPIGKMPLFFVENRGQFDPRVSHYVQGRDNTIYFTPDGITFALTSPQRGPAPVVSGEVPTKTATNQVDRWIVKLDFLGANPEVKPCAEAPRGTIISYFKGRPEQWQTGLKTYSQIRYPDLWPGVDVVYTGSVNRLKYQFEVKPGTDPSQIRLAYRGAGRVTPNESGELEVATPVGTFRDNRPVAWQEVDGRRVEVSVDYDLEPAAEGHRAYGYKLGAYSPDRPLVIDPAVIVYAGYIGGSGTDSYSKIAVDNAGYAYVTGFTNSSEGSFSDVAGPDLTYGGNGDAFVAKVAADGSALVYVLYIGGTNVDDGRSIAVDAEGNAYIVGKTKSDETSFPVKVGPDLTANGLGDAFVAKVNAAGTDLVYAGYIGGADYEEPRDIAVDADGSAYVTGWTASDESTFPVKVGPFLTLNSGGDAFVAKVAADGTSLIYAGYIGGNSSDTGNGIAVDAAGNAYVVGQTGSDDATFPVKGGPGLIFKGLAGYTDAFVAKVAADGTGLVYAGYIGGEDQDWATGVAVDGVGSAYVTGMTGSKETSFPVKDGPDTTWNGGLDAFVAKVVADGSGLVYAGYIGGQYEDGGYGIAVDPAGNAYVAGYTASPEATFPVVGGPGLTYKGQTDAFVAKVAAHGVNLVYAGYIGGTATDIGTGIAVSQAGDAYVTGHTLSTESSFPVKVGPKPTHSGDLDVFVAKVSLVPDEPKDTNLWLLDYNGNGKWDKPPKDRLYTYGLPGDVPMTDRVKNYGRFIVVRGNKWFLDWNDNRQRDSCYIDQCFTYGQPGDVPVGAWLGEGFFSFFEIGVKRGSRWHFDRNVNRRWENCEIDRCYTFGKAGDKPVTGDWNGDGADEIGIVRGNTWVLDYNGNGRMDNCKIDRCYTFGRPGDVPVVGKWSRKDKRDKIGVKRGATWYLDYNGNGKWDGTPKDRRFTFGKPLDIPVVGDWNGDGKDEIGIVRTKP